ncbi:cytochrome c oxidase assembly protein [Croceibacterium aestuarii]|uniref:cytochrome c oxidase assembly protein n=1 Tax=Croceibacterium aestuarii TaxID=3064139 RepID=UPI00272ECC0F|nr:cytochrome c oxidase assembly protein [Croceibacterium sp. D39]
MPFKRWFCAAGLLAASAPAFAHGDEVHEGQSAWSLWQFSPEIILGLVIAGLIYWRGSRHGLVERRWRIAAFFGGLLALFVALISPVEGLADHIFAVHQVEHMLLRTVAPMLLFLSAPQAAMVRGSPRWLTRFFAGSGWLRGLVGVLRWPPLATVLFLAASYFWMLPRFHDMAILDEPIHYLWHVSLLLTGLVFFSVIFDRRAAPQGPALGTRLGMFLAAALGNIVLGAFLTLKDVSLYSAYLELGHMWHVSELTDEQTGGIIMWIPGTMMFALSAIWVVYSWSSEETRFTERRMRSGRELAGARAKSNSALALGLAVTALLILVLAVSVVSLIDHPPGGARDYGIAGKIPG